MSNKFISKILIGYITIISSYLSIMLYCNLEAILAKVNIILILITIVSSAVCVINFLFFFKKEIISYRNLIYLNAGVCILSSFKLRFAGFLVDNLVGTQINVYATRNYGGSAFGINFEPFDIALVFSFYDAVKYSGFLFQCNLVTIAIAAYLLVSYLKVSTGRSL